MTSSINGVLNLNSQDLQFALLKHDREWYVGKSSRRGKLDIIAEILLCCGTQKTKTSIMYKANLNYSQLKDQISALTSQGLIEKKVNKYTTTKKGYQFLQLFAQMNDLLDETREQQIIFQR